MSVELRPPQGDVFLSTARFRVLVAGRRFGKTFLACVELLRASIDPDFSLTPPSKRLSWYVAPTYRQAKKDAWRPLKALTRPYWGKRPNETDLSIELRCGARIELRGADNYDRLRGSGLDFLVADEFKDVKKEAWTHALRPMLSDRLGRALFTGTPQGMGYFYELWEEARIKADWAAFQFTSEDGGNISREEIEASAADLDEKTFRQEFQASFENMAAGAIYYAFNRDANIAPQGFLSANQLCWALD